ncbi:hypothetical protein ACWDAS_41255, partial [Streptomyces sp. NPDC001070]
CKPSTSPSTADSPSAAANSHHPSYTVRWTDPITGEGLHATSRSLDGELPNPEKVLPTDTPTIVTVDYATLREALQGVALVAEGTAAQVDLDITEGTITLRGGDKSTGHARDWIDADLTGEPMRICFNAQYLLSALSSVDAPKVQLTLGSPTKPALIYAAGESVVQARFVVMPIRRTG